MLPELRYRLADPSRLAVRSRPPEASAPTLCEIGWQARDGRRLWDRVAPPPGPGGRAAVAILAAGTPVDADGGPVAVESLVPGQAVLGRAGLETIVWVGAAFPDRDDAGAPPLYRIAAGALGFGRPASDVVLGHGAHVLVESARCRPLVGAERAFAPVGALEDGLRVIALRPPRGVATHGLACVGQATVSAAGLPVAAWHPASSPDPISARDLAPLVPPLWDDTFGAAPIPYLSASEARGLAGG